MKAVKKVINLKRSGAALIISMIFVIIFSALAVAMASLSSKNVQLSSNEHKSNSALSTAQSGLEILRYYLSKITVSGMVAPEDRLQTVATELQNQFYASGSTYMYAYYDSSNSTLSIPYVMLDSRLSKNFNAVLNQLDSNTVQLDLTGNCGQLSRVIRVIFNYESKGFDVFDYGVATKGPLSMEGDSEFDGTNVAIESSVYIEGDVSIGDAFSITNRASVAGDITIANPYATYTVGSLASVGGAVGEEAEEHVFVGNDYVDFPTPDPTHFQQYATGMVIDENSDWNNQSTLNNVTIKAGTNPTFSGNVTINGVLFIETPNVVNFSGQSTVNGVIVGDGQLGDDTSNSNITFAGQVVCNDASGLTGAEFDGIRQETGTFIMAPGFSLDFSGETNTINGVIAGSGISFSGQAGGTINGSIINYSDEPMTLNGESTLMFNRTGAGTASGFVPNKTLEYQSASYSEMIY